jgi:hypothetical protein
MAKFGIYNIVIMVGDSVGHQMYMESFLDLARTGMIGKMSSPCYTISSPREDGSIFNVFRIPAMTLYKNEEFEDFKNKLRALYPSEDGKMLIILNIGLHFYRGDVSHTNANYLISNQAYQTATDMPKMSWSSYHSDFEQSVTWKGLSHSCVPFTSEEMYHANNWRNIMAREILKKVDTRHQIGIIDFFRITAARHDAHKSSSDCTHWCLGGMMWRPLWHHLTVE